VREAVASYGLRASMDSSACWPRCLRRVRLVGHPSLRCLVICLTLTQQIARLGAAANLLELVLEERLSSQQAHCMRTLSYRCAHPIAVAILEYWQYGSHCCTPGSVSAIRPQTPQTQHKTNSSSTANYPDPAASLDHCFNVDRFHETRRSNLFHEALNTSMFLG
jgi:hypothetical protein